MSHVLVRLFTLAMAVSPLPARAEIALQIVDPASVSGQQVVMVGQLPASVALFHAATIDQAGAGLTNLAPTLPQVLAATSTANAAFVEQAAGLAAPAGAYPDPDGNTSLIERLGLANTATVEQTGLLNTSLIVQGGTANDCTVIQSSNGNASMVSQTGSNGFVSVRQGWIDQKTVASHRKLPRLAP